jgi:hypothetical protein
MSVATPVVTIGLGAYQTSKLTLPSVSMLSYPCKSMAGWFSVIGSIEKIEARIYDAYQARVCGIDGRHPCSAAAGLFGRC